MRNLGTFNNFSPTNAYINTMINFFLQIFGDLKLTSSLFMFSLTLGIPCLFGFLCSVFYRHFKFKLLWITLWSTILCTFIGACIYFTNGAINSNQPNSNIAHLTIIAFSLIILLHVACLFYSKFFRIKKIFHWLFVLLIPIASFFIMAFWMWNAAKEPWGSIAESPLQSADLENTSDAEYEIEYSFIEKGWHEFSTVIFRKQNSDITYRTIYSMCDDFAYKGDSIYDDFVLRRSDYAGDTSQWNNLDDKRISIVEELKRKIEEYEIEYSWENSSSFPYTILYGDPVIVSLKNFKSQTRKELVLKNSSEAGVHKAIAIEKLMRKAWPAREAFTKLTEEEVIQNCWEAQKNQPHPRFKEFIL
ncbi:hypothetical protein SAMN05720758_2237 [Fibrobacter sp. UWB11]|nr:hypothetical protein SAMN05720758_2237 [Fibrobacter sp. UWB11]